MYEYFLKRSELELVEGQLSSLETARKNEEIRLSQAKAQLEMLQKERSEKQEIATNIRVELRHNQEFVALEEEKKELKRLRDKRQEAMNEETELKKSVAQAARDCESLLRDVYKRQAYTTPGAALELGIAGEKSHKVLFVAIARTLGIPARLNPADGAIEYWDGMRFVAVLEESRKESHLTAVSYTHLKQRPDRKRL